MNLKSYLTHKNIFIFGLVLLAIGMPVSRFLVSISQIILLGNWLVERNFSWKWDTLKKSKMVWAFIGIYLLYIIGLLWTSDYTYGLKDLRIKLPMLWLPVLFFTSEPLTKKQYHIILHFFVAATVVASFCSMAVYMEVTHKKINNIRDISIFESHIRFSLMIVFAIVYLFFCFLKPEILKQKIIYLLVAAWLLFFLFVLQSFTGLVILGVVAFVGIAVFLFSKESVILKITLLALFIGCSSYLVYIVTDEWKKTNAKEYVSFKNLPIKTLNGNLYWNDTISKMTENSHYIYISVCYDELKKQWGKRSIISYTGVDYKQNELHYTLERYLASKGLSRDSAGFSKLTDADIKNIENGCSNYLYTSSTNIRTRIHEIIWEMCEAKDHQETNGHSITMRVEFWKTAYHIITQNYLIGVGTGDVELAFKQQYEKDKTKLMPQWQLRSHNQFLSVTVALGFVGLALFLISLIAPFFSVQKISMLFILFMIIQVLSFFNEDTLETQAGVTFCIFFTQLLYHNNKHNL